MLQLVELEFKFICPWLGWKHSSQARYQDYTALTNSLWYFCDGLGRWNSLAINTHQCESCWPRVCETHTAEDLVLWNYSGIQAQQRLLSGSYQHSTLHQPLPSPLPVCTTLSPSLFGQPLFLFYRCFFSYHVTGCLAAVFSAWLADYSAVTATDSLLSLLLLLFVSYDFRVHY